MAVVSYAPMPVLPADVRGHYYCRRQFYRRHTAVLTSFWNDQERCWQPNLMEAFILRRYFAGQLELYKHEIETLLGDALVQFKKEKDQQGAAPDALKSALDKIDYRYSLWANAESKEQGSGSRSLALLRVDLHYIKLLIAHGYRWLDELPPALNGGAIIKIKGFGPKGVEQLDAALALPPAAKLALQSPLI